MRLRFGPASAVLCLALAACSANATPAPSATAVATATVAPSPTSEPTLEVDALLDVIHAAAANTLAEETVEIVFDAGFKGNRLIPEGTGFDGTGAASFIAPKQMILEADFEALELGLVSMIVDGTNIYMTGDFLSEALEPGQWLLIDTTSPDPAVIPFISLTKGQNDLSLVMYYLFGGFGDVHVLQPRTIDGVATTQYGLEVDLDLAADLVPAAVREPMLDSVAELRTSGVERALGAHVWIGDDDGLVYRTDYEYRLGAQGGGGTMSVRYDFSAFGEALELGIPEDSLIVRIEDVAP